MDFFQILEKRRAINFFDPNRDVSVDELKAIVEDAAAAPSSYNLQPWKLKVLRSAEEKGRLRKLAFDQPKVTEAPVVLMVLGDREGWTPECATLQKTFTANVESGKMQQDQLDWFLGATKGLYGSSEAASQAFANKNAALFAMSLMYAATARGLETHPMDGFNLEGVRAEFAIPDNYWLPMLIALGHRSPDANVHPKAWRQSYEEIVLD